MDEKVNINHGSGGMLTRNLIHDLFLRHFDNRILNALTDSAVLPGKTGHFAFTTDSYVVDPVFFPGGNIGKLAICGTVNDLSVSGAVPLYIAASFILEEGFPLGELEMIVISMRKEAKKAGVKIVTGDTKVVQKGKADKLFITTSGIGFMEEKHAGLSYARGTRPGDLVLINGTIGDHGMTILNARESLRFSSGLQSDCTCLNKFIQTILSKTEGVKFMRDATRGGLAAVLCELAEKTGMGIEITEDSVPVKEEVRGLCELLGFEALHLANEGKVVLIASKKTAGNILGIMKKQKPGRESAIIGRIVAAHPGKVKLITTSGGSRWIDVPAGEQLPRIC